MTRLVGICIVTACAACSKAQPPTQAEVRAQLAPLKLHASATGDDDFDVRGGKCNLVLIAVGDAVRPYIEAHDVGIVVNQAQNAIVKVVPYQGTARELCLSAVRTALHW